MDTSSGKTPLPLPTLDKEACPKVFGKLIGHLAAQLHPLQTEIEKLYADKLLTLEKYAEFKHKTSLEKFQTELAPHLTKYLQARPTAILSINEGMAEAKANTFDKNGARKETPLTPIYAKILEHWQDIEKMSGPTELAKFLRAPMKGNKHAQDAQLDRVKMICYRLGMTFRRPVK